MDVTISKSLVAWIRVKKLMARVSLTDLLFNLVTVSFKKVIIIPHFDHTFDLSLNLPYITIYVTTSIHLLIIFLNK